MPYYVPMPERKPNLELYRRGPELRSPAWVAEQNARTADALGRNTNAWDEIVKDLENFSSIDISRPPITIGDKMFRWTKPVGQDRPSVVRQFPDGTSHTILYPSSSDEVRMNYSVYGDASLRNLFSRDGSQMAYLHTQSGSEIGEIRVIDTATGETIEVANGSNGFYPTIAWLPNGSGFYYTGENPQSRDPNERKRKVYFHKMGEKKDQIVYEPSDHKDLPDISISDDGKTIVVEVSKNFGKDNPKDVFIAPCPEEGDEGFLELRPILSDEIGVMHPVVYEDHIYVRTSNNASNARVMRTQLPSKLEKVDSIEWEEVVPEKQQAVLERFYVIGGKGIAQYTDRSCSRLSIVDLDTKKEQALPLPSSVGTVSSIEGDVDSSVFTFSFESFTLPPVAYESNVETKNIAALDAVEEVSEVVVQQLAYPSEDGTRIPLLMVDPSGENKRKKAVLFAYGSFGAVRGPKYDPFVLTLAKHGLSFGIAGVRGGGEYGREWTEAGNGVNKDTSIIDVREARRFLAGEGYKVGLYGLSGSGVTLGGAMAKNPELFAGVYLNVPVVDLMNFVDYPGNGHEWTSTFGDPHDATQKKKLRDISPLHNLVAGKRYPPTLTVVGLSDSKVYPLHSIHWYERLQAINPYRMNHLLWVTDGGHGVSSSGSQSELHTQHADAISFFENIAFASR